MAMQMHHINAIAIRILFGVTMDLYFKGYLIKINESVHRHERNCVY